MRTAVNSLLITVHALNGGHSHMPCSVLQLVVESNSTMFPHRKPGCIPLLFF